jgi:hypothetical protein
MVTVAAAKDVNLKECDLSDSIDADCVNIYPKMIYNVLMVTQKLRAIPMIIFLVMTDFG